MSKKNQPDELIGFRDFLEHDAKQKPPQRNKRAEGYELITFLERESQRLEKVIDLCQDQTYVLKNFSQGDKLLIEIKNETIKHQMELISIIKREDSHLSQNIDELLQNHFNS